MSIILDKFILQLYFVMIKLFLGVKFPFLYFYVKSMVQKELVEFNSGGTWDNKKVEVSTVKIF